MVGSPFYIAPEVVKGKYSYKCDIWSIGVITFQILSGSVPFKGDNLREIFHKIVKGKIHFGQK
jgi:calcium-dependent protein kinase